MNAIYMLKPGMLTTIQDIGRWGHQSRGVPVAGPMDLCSHRLANALVGNDDSAAALEITLIGPDLEFGDERLVAVAGGEFDLTLDGRPASHLAPFLVSSGSQLRFGDRRIVGRPEKPSQCGLQTKNREIAAGHHEAAAALRLPLIR